MPENTAVVFDGPGAVSVTAQPVPEPSANEVLIETERTLISTGTELAQFDPTANPYVDDAEYDYPIQPGYCNIGTVVECGENVTSTAVGQTVASYSSHAKYVTAADPETTTDHFGTFRPVGPAVPPEDAAFFTIAEIVMNGIRRGRVDWGECVGVFGLGLLGQIAVRVAHHAGAAQVVGYDLDDDRRSYLPETPRVSGLDPTADDTTGFEDAPGDELADVVFELTGNPSAIPSEFDVLREQGRLVVLSSPRGETTFNFDEYCSQPSYEIIGSHNASHPSVATPHNPWTQQAHAEVFFHLLSTGELAVSNLITNRYAPEDAEDVYPMLSEDRTQALGVIFEW
jgi:2-desacetyl-2-hydroxyethyl bacteriochlorophyllide A dehydrogenase